MSRNCVLDFVLMFNQERLPAPDVHEEEEDEGGGQLHKGDRDETVVNIFLSGKGGD